MSNLRNIIALLILGTTDAYLISHPNIIGRLGVFVYKYSMIKNFPSALITVFITLGICFAISALIIAHKEQKWAKYLLIAFMLLSTFIFVQVLLKFTGGTYAHTGKSFVWGMILLPILMLYIFVNAWFTLKVKSDSQGSKLI